MIQAEWSACKSQCHHYSVQAVNFAVLSKLSSSRNILFKSVGVQLSAELLADVGRAAFPVSQRPEHSVVWNCSCFLHAAAASFDSSSRQLWLALCRGTGKLQHTFLWETCRKWKLLLTLILSDVNYMWSFTTAEGIIINLYLNYNRFHYKPHFIATKCSWLLPAIYINWPQSIASIYPALRTAAGR